MTNQQIEDYDKFNFFFCKDSRVSDNTYVNRYADFLNFNTNYNYQICITDYIVFLENLPTTNNNLIITRINMATQNRDDSANFVCNQQFNSKQLAVETVAATGIDSVLGFLSTDESFNDSHMLQLRSTQAPSADRFYYFNSFDNNKQLASPYMLKFFSTTIKSPIWIDVKKNVQSTNQLKIQTSDFFDNPVIGGEDISPYFGVMITLMFRKKTNLLSSHLLTKEYNVSSFLWNPDYQRILTNGSQLILEINSNTREGLTYTRQEVLPDTTQLPFPLNNFRQHFQQDIKILPNTYFSVENVIAFPKRNFPKHPSAATAVYGEGWWTLPELVTSTSNQLNYIIGQVGTIPNGITSQMFVVPLRVYMESNIISRPTIQPNNVNIENLEGLYQSRFRNRPSIHKSIMNMGSKTENFIFTCLRAQLSKTDTSASKSMVPTLALAEPLNQQRLFKLDINAPVNDWNLYLDPGDMYDYRPGPINANYTNFVMDISALWDIEITLRIHVLPE